MQQLEANTLRNLPVLGKSWREQVLILVPLWEGFWSDKWQQCVVEHPDGWSGICSCCSAASEPQLMGPSSLLTTQPFLHKSHTDTWKHIGDNRVCQAPNYFSSVPGNETLFFISTWRVWPPLDLSAHSPNKWQTTPGWKNDGHQTVGQPQKSRELRNPFPLSFHSFITEKKVSNNFPFSVELQPSALI